MKFNKTILQLLLAIAVCVLCASATQGNTIAQVEPDQADFDCTTVMEIPQVECEALVAIYNENGGLNWSGKEGWLETTLPCGWNGVSCSDGHVYWLEMDGISDLEGLTGALSPEIGNLSNLHTLSLSNYELTTNGNQLTSIPPEIGNLSNLERLDIENNQLESIPEEISQLSKLRDLGLRDNQLSHLPTEIGLLSNLEELFLSGNQLSSIPTEIGALSKLEVLLLSGNQLTDLPIEITNLTALTNLNVGNNSLQPTDSNLISFLDSKDSDWASSQIVPTPIPTDTSTPEPTSTPTPTNTQIPANLLGSVTVDQGEIDSGGTATWYIQIVNTGETDAENARLETELPAGTTLAPESESLGWICTTVIIDEPEPIETCVFDLDSLDTLVPNGEINTSFSVLPTDINPNDPQIQEPSIIVKSNGNPDGINISAGSGNNDVEVDLFSGGVPTGGLTSTPANLVGSVEFEDGFMAVGETATWLILLSNNGGTTAENVRLEIALRDGLVLAPESEALGWYLYRPEGVPTGGGQNFALDLGTLAANDAINTSFSAIPSELLAGATIQQPPIVVKSDSNLEGMNISEDLGEITVAVPTGGFTPEPTPDGTILIPVREDEVSEGGVPSQLQTAVPEPTSTNTPIPPTFDETTLQQNIDLSNLTLNGSGQPGSTIELMVDGQSIGTTTVDPDGTWTLDTSFDEGGKYIISLNAFASNGDPLGSTEPAIIFVPTATPVPTDTPQPTFTPTETPTPTLTPTSFIPNTPTATPTLLDEHEVNNECLQAKSIATDGKVQRHGFFQPNDRDWIRFDVEANETYRVEVQSPVNSRADVDLQIYARCEDAPIEESMPAFTPGIRLDVPPMSTATTLYLRLNNHDGSIFGEDVIYDVSVRPLQSGQNGAVIILGGRLKAPDRVQPNIDFVTDEVYDLFKDNGYSDDEILYLSTDGSRAGFDEEATNANLREAITEWAVDKVGPEQPLTLYLMDHGDIDKLYVDEPNGEVLDPDDLDAWLTELEEQVPDLKSNIIVEACHAGSFILEGKSVSKPGRLVITSTNEKNVAYASRRGAQFSDRFLTLLREGYNLTQSFWQAEEAVRQVSFIQEPWIDANGDSIPDNRTDQYDIADHEAGTDRLDADTWAPYIVWAESPQIFENNSGEVRAEVRDNKEVVRVWASVYAPSYVPPQHSRELVPEELPTFDLEPLGDNLFSGTYDDFTEEGEYKIAIYAEDNDGLKARLLVLTAPGGGVFGTGGPPIKAFLPIIQR